MNENPAAEITVLIVDDHRVVRLGLRTLLEETEDLKVIAEANNSASAVSEALRTRPDVVLLDIRLPDKDGFETCRKLKDAMPNLRVLMLTSVADDHVILQAISAGADGYLLKALEDIDIPQAIRKVASGAAMLDPVVTRRVLEQIKSAQPGGAKQFATLSQQERRVLELVASGLTNKEIAAAMKLGEKTIRNYLSSVFDKLRISRRSEAAALYAKEVMRDERTDPR